jgi:hypothetical protein
VNVNDGVTVVGFITAVPTNIGPTTPITIQLAGSGLSVVVQAQDIGASTQTL